MNLDWHLYVRGCGEPFEGLGYLMVFVFLVNNVLFSELLRPKTKHLFLAIFQEKEGEGKGRFKSHSNDPARISDRVKKAPLKN